MGLITFASGYSAYGMLVGTTGAVSGRLWCSFYNNKVILLVQLYLDIYVSTLFYNIHIFVWAMERYVCRFLNSPPINKSIRRCM